MTKLAVVVGATGNQGGSVARRFAQDKAYRVRGLTRKPDSPAAQALVALGIEVVAADLDDVASLKAAFAGASVIFSVTNYWEPFFRPDCRARAAETGVPIRRFAYDVEVRQGKNIAEAAAATATTLDANGFLASTLSHAGQASGGRCREVYHHDAKADVFPGHVQAQLPALAAKASWIQTGYFTSSYRLLPDAYLGRQPDGSFLMQFCTDPAKAQPHLAVNEDVGAFVYAVHQMPPGHSYMAASAVCTWPDWAAAWGRVNGRKTSYRQVTSEAMSALCPEKEFGDEVAAMFSYSSDPGYDGGEKLLLPEDLRKARIDPLHADPC